MNSNIEGIITQFEALDGGNGASNANVLETWQMYGCFLQEVNYNNFDYNSNDPATISLTIRYDNALQVPQTSGVGKTITRTFGAAITG